MEKKKTKKNPETGGFVEDHEIKKLKKEGNDDKLKPRKIVSIPDIRAIGRKGARLSMEST